MLENNFSAGEVLSKIYYSIKLHKNRDEVSEFT